MTRSRGLVVASLIGLALLGFFEFPGHAWLQQDTQIWIPMFERLWDSTALQNDLVALKPHLSFTIYDESAIALRWITRSSFHVVLAAEQIIFRILELLGVYLLARSFGFARHLSIFIAASFGLGATIIGPAVLTIEYEPVPRGFALAFLFLAMGLAARGRMRLAGAATAMAFLYHAPTSIPIAIILFLICVRRRDYRPLVPLACAVVLLFIASRFQAGSTEPQPFFETIDPSWEKLERMRASYNWVSVWVNPLIWQYVFFAGATMFAAWRLRLQNARWFVLGLPVIGLLSVPVSYILTEKVKWSVMPQIQPARAVLWITALTAIVAAAAAIRAAERRIWWEATLWFSLVFVIPIETRLTDLRLPHVLLTLALAAAASSAFMIRNRRTAAVALAAVMIVPYFAIPIVGRVKNYPYLHTPEIEALVDYARTNTPKDAMFLFPDAGRGLDPGLFRAESLRSVYVDWKAGGQVNYFRSLAEDWWARWQATMSGKDIAANLDRFRRLGIGYVVLNASHPLAGMAPVYSNSRYLMYRLD